MDDTTQLMLRGLCRGLHLAGYFTSFGAIFLPAILWRRGTVQGLKPLAWVGLGLALLAGVAWLLLQAAYFASAQDFADVTTAIPAVLQYTRFGNLLLGRMAVLLLAVLLFQANLPRLAALLAFGGVVAQAWLGHGGAMTGPVGDVLLTTAILHLAAAALWLGTLPALLVAVAKLPDATALVRRYSPFGMGCVAALLLTALVQYQVLIGHPAALLNSGYGGLALAKTVMLALLIVVAARNKLRLAPSLPTSHTALLRAISVEIALGLLVLVAAGTLLQLAPPAMANMG